MRCTACFRRSPSVAVVLVWIWYFLVYQDGVVLATSNATTTGTFAEELEEKILNYIGTPHPLRHDGLVRWFKEYPPPTFSTSSDGASIPVLLLLHYGAGNMRSSNVLGRLLEKDPWLRLAAQHGYLVLVPGGVAPKRNGRDGFNTQPYKGDWNDYLSGRDKNVAGVDDVGFLSKLVDWAIEQRNGDPKRIYIYGYSNGGMMVQRMLIERPTMFAAGVSVVANLPDFDVPLPTHGTPLFLMCATNDTYTPYNGGPASAKRGNVRSAEDTRDFFITANNAGPEMIETVLPDLDPNDNCRIISQYYPSDTGTPVQYYILEGSGHNFAGEFSRQIAGLKFPKFLNKMIEDLLGNACNDADGIQLAFDFIQNFTRP